MADEPTQSLATRNEGLAVSIIVQTSKTLDEARNAAQHGDYAGARQSVKAARDQLYFAEIELRKAEMAARRQST